VHRLGRAGSEQNQMDLDGSNDLGDGREERDEGDGEGRDGKD